MTEEAVTRLSALDRLKWWIYERCFAVCIRITHPDADPSEFCLLDRSYFIALSKDEAREIMEESPEQSWRLEALFE